MAAPELGSVISTPMDEEVIDEVVEEFEGALRVIEPHVAGTRPELLAR